MYAWMTTDIVFKQLNMFYTHQKTDQLNMPIVFNHLKPASVSVSNSILFLSVSLQSKARISWRTTSR